MQGDIDFDILDFEVNPYVPSTDKFDDASLDQVRTRFFRPSATVSPIGLMESCTCRRCRGGPPPPKLSVMKGQPYGVMSASWEGAGAVRPLR